MSKLQSHLVTTAMEVVRGQANDFVATANVRDGECVACAAGQKFSCSTLRWCFREPLNNHAPSVADHMLD